MISRRHRSYSVFNYFKAEVLRWQKLTPFLPEPQRQGEVNSRRGVTKKMKGQKK